MARWILILAVAFAVGCWISIPIALLTLLGLAFISGAPLFAIMLGAAMLGALDLPRAFGAELGGMSVSTDRALRVRA
jgi:hypothetical protein